MSASVPPPTVEVAAPVAGAAPPRPSRLARFARHLATFVAGAATGLAAAGVYSSTRGDAPAAWHRLVPPGELDADAGGLPGDLAAYRRLEDALFASTARGLVEAGDTLPAFSRFDPASPTHPSRFARDWNRTFELPPAGPLRGEALLLHGLSDAPYSLRAAGALLAAHGFHVVGLRLPGHGTVPAALAAVTRDDWRAAVRIGVAATGGRAGAANVPFVVVGYSNGAALALDATLAALLDGDGRVPDRLVFLSPALAVEPAAALARWPHRLSRLPGLGKLAWLPIEHEFDPFKYNSFPIVAGAEIHDLTEEVAERLERLDAAGGSLPPMLSLQSVVDATIPPVASLTRLYSRAGPESELVLFDANRAQGIRRLLTVEADELLALGKGGRRFPFRVTVVTNERTGTATVEALSRAPGELAVTAEPLGLVWPDGVYSLSHVAMPIPPDDPAYGTGTSPLGPPFPFGALELRGERGIFRIPQGLLTRLRYNPFYPVVEDRVRAFLGLDGLPPGPGPLTGPPAGH